MHLKKKEEFGSVEELFNTLKGHGTTFCVPEAELSGREVVLAPGTDADLHGVEREDNLLVVLD